MSHELDQGRKVFTVIKWPFYNSGSSCGYCQSQTESRKYGFSAVQTTVEVYQQLIDRGFRRSGTYMYKPDMLYSCCPQYTIRLDVKAFKPQREHRQALNRFNRHVNCQLLTDTSANKHKGKQNQAYNLQEEIQRGVCEDFQVRLETSTFSQEKFQLYKKYQMTVHDDREGEVSPRGFVEFLCKSPFIASNASTIRISTEKSPGILDLEDETARSSLMGPVHQTYYHKGKLIAIAVLDLLPHCISSVYFIWDPDYAKFGLGKIASLREIALCRDLNRPYYYMGFYIHNCSKMRYKSQYSPSFLLDPQFSQLSVDQPSSSHWFALNQQSVDMLDDFKYISPIGQRTGTLAKPQLEKLRQVQTGQCKFIDLGIPGVLSRQQVKDLESSSDFNPSGDIPLMIYYNNSCDDDDEGNDDDPLYDGPSKLGNYSVVYASQVVARARKVIQELLEELTATVGVEIAKTIAVDLR